MAGPWSSGWSFGFGPLNAEGFPVSNRDPALMTVLAFSPTETLLYDYGNSENFYVLVKPPELAQMTLFVVSPFFASQWYGLTQSKTVICNPFLFNSYKLSTVVQQ